MKGGRRVGKKCLQSFFVCVVFPSFAFDGYCCCCCRCCLIQGELPNILAFIHCENSDIEFHYNYRSPLIETILLNCCQNRWAMPLTMCLRYFFYRLSFLVCCLCEFLFYFCFAFIEYIESLNTFCSIVSFSIDHESKRNSFHWWNFHCVEQTIEWTNKQERKNSIERSFFQWKHIDKHHWPIQIQKAKERESRRKKKVSLSMKVFFLLLLASVAGYLWSNSFVDVRVHRLDIIVSVRWTTRARLRSPLKSNSMDMAYETTPFIQRLAAVMNEGRRAGANKSRIFMGHCV